MDDYGLSRREGKKHMLHLAVYGKTKWSILMKSLIETEYSQAFEVANQEQVVVDCFVVEKPEQEDEVSFVEFAQNYHSGEISAIIIPKEYYIPYNELVQKLIRLAINVNDIYNGMRLSEQMRERGFDVSALLTPMLQDSYLPYLEYHVADHCNLNCKYCTHYSPLVPNAVFTDFEQWKMDLMQLKQYIDDIGVIRILGGEPLLNPQLPQFVEMTRRLFPKTIITVVTNGMLLDRISQELVDVMQRTISFFHISYYPPFEEKADAVKRFLVEKEIGFTMSPLIAKFNKTQILEKNPDEEFFYSCFQATCTCIHQGKLAPCYAPFTTKYFNEAFGKNLPVDEGIDLYAEDNTTYDMKLKLLYPLERCQYCIGGKEYPWEIVGKNSKLEDWIEDDWKTE